MQRFQFKPSVQVEHKSICFAFSARDNTMVNDFYFLFVLDQICVRLVQELERARQYRAALTLYQLMVKDGVDFYENDILNGE